MARITSYNVCYTKLLRRSGDKGDTANIGVIARAPEIYPWLKKTLSAAVVKRRFKGLCEGKVERFEAPNMWALNFLLHESLGGGGIASLRNDPQGKAYAQILLDIPIAVPESVARDLEAAVINSSSIHYTQLYDPSGERLEWIPDAFRLAD